MQARSGRLSLLPRLSFFSLLPQQRGPLPRASLLPASAARQGRNPLAARGRGEKGGKGGRGHQANHAGVREEGGDGAAELVVAGVQVAQRREAALDVGKAPPARSGAQARGGQPPAVGIAPCARARCMAYGRGCCCSCSCGRHLSGSRRTPGSAPKHNSIDSAGLCGPVALPR